MEIDSSDDEQSLNGQSMEPDDEIMTQTKHLIAGKIVTIHIKNFLTHTETTVHPSEQLNLVIGPNGTGKSSIVASIILGMGGSTKILSERNKLADYVKNGKDVAQITVTVYIDERRNMRHFRREFNRKNKSTYYIDQRKVTEKDYVAEISTLNIQVGNLCQFLPQERVQDFAKQNPQELFASTQKSVCDEDMIEMFDQLKELRSNQLNGNKQIQKTEDLLKENESRVALLQTAVDNIRRQDELVRRKGTIEKKLAWMDFEESYIKCKEVDKELDVAKKNFAEQQKKKNELQKYAEGKAKERQKYEKSLANETTKKKKCVDELNRISGEVEKLEIEMRNAKSDLDAYIQNAEERQRKINENELVLNTFKQECVDYLETIVSVDDVKAKIAEIEQKVQLTREKIRSLTDSRAKFNFQIENVVKPNIVVIDNKINALNSVADAKLNYLQNNFPDAYAAVMWLRQNQSMFRGKIYEPMIMEISVRSNEYSKYIENCVKVQDLIAFTCEESEDMNKFLKICRIDNKLQVNAVHSPAGNTLRFKSRVPIAELRKLGGEIYLIDCFDAPIPIQNFLCQSYNFQNVLIGNASIERKADMLPPTLALFFTPTHRIASKISKYTGGRSLMTTELKTKNMLNVRVSQAEVDELTKQKTKLTRERDSLFNKRNEIEQTINVMEDQCKTGFQQKGEAQKRILKLQQLEKNVKMQENKLQRLVNETIDVDGQKEIFSVHSKEIVKKMLKFNENSIAVYEKMLDIELNETKAKARMIIFRNGTANFDAELMECNDEIDRIKRLCDRIGSISDKAKQETREKQLIALKLTENHKPTEGDRFPYKKDFDELSNDRRELAEEVEDLEQQINCRSTDDQAVLDDYNQRIKTIEALKKDLKKNSKSSNDMEHEIITVHNKWFGKISTIVKSINQNFGEFMNSMNCAGEVELVFPSERDYEQYGIEIRVKYRSNEKLRALDRFVQSGGERAVAIAVYSLSLQHLSQVPFRCVDEINQGMDPNNERRVFEMLVRNVAQPGQSQFFYVTPKLQPNLPYNEYVTCITVFNGPYTNHNDYFENV